jgi:hypothetical protein
MWLVRGYKERYRAFASTYDGFWGLSLTWLMQERE